MTKLGLGLASLLLSAGVLIACAPSDSDGDGDGDGSADADLPPAPDEDGDLISDTDEGRAANTDTDGDGTPDYLDDDSDGDGVPDVREAGDNNTNTQPPDSDGDGLPDFRDPDADGNGLGDAVDGTEDLDGDGRQDFADLDDDGDGLTDVAEMGADPLAPVDTDMDLTPDYRDTDSDGDTIEDKHELASDPDMDMIPAFRDLDSDGDCIPDALEAGDADPLTPPRNSDADSAPDFLDVDGDNDGLLDQLEDVNCNGQLDAGEADPSSGDTDMDGISDLVEVAAGTDPQDAGSNPQANGDFVFVVPYVMPPSPDKDTLDFSTTITQADVAFAMDTTGSMGGEITALKNALTGTIIPGLIAEVPNVAIGVADYKDFPTSPYGSAGNFPFKLLHRVMTVTTMAGRNSVQGAVNALSAGGGLDGPESGWEALFQIATGAGTTQGGANVPAFNGATAPPLAIPAGESVGTIGGVGFRTGSLPVVVLITDAASHNGSNALYNYSGISAATLSTATQQLVARGGKLIGVVSAAGDTPDTEADVTAGVVASGTTVPASAWGPAGTRPAGCNINQCCTGINGAGEAQVGGACPLVFNVDSNGGGLGNTVVTAIKVLTNFVVLDITGTPEDDPSDSVDAVASFVDRIVAVPNGMAPCATGLTVSDRVGGDGIPETFDNVQPGTQVCFDVVPKQNTTVMPTTAPQMFKATIRVLGDGVTLLDTRDIYFLVPPVIPPPPLE